MLLNLDDMFNYKRPNHLCSLYHVEQTHRHSAIAVLCCFCIIDGTCSREKFIARHVEPGSFRLLSSSPLSRLAHFPFRPESFRPRVVSPTFPFAPESFRPLPRSPLSRFAHFPVRPWVVSPPYKILFLVLIFRPQKWYKAWIFLLIDDFSL